MSKLEYLTKNPGKIKDYAGNIHNGMFRKCKKCRGKGIIEHLDATNNIVGIFCKCVRENLKREIENGSNNP
jgi:hypothetical protein